MFLATATTAILYWATAPANITVGNRRRIREGIRLTAHVVVWAIIASSAISLLLPSPWS